jgi:formate dehydrogenase subunit gamma
LRTDAIPLDPVPLSADQAEEMLQHQLKKHYLTSILLHWSNAIVWLLELLTGAALISSPHFRVAPDWYLTIAQDVFGTRASMLRFHMAVGITWLFVFVVYGTFGFRAYLGWDVLNAKLFLDADDRRWLVVRTLRILGRSREPLPPQGIYNAGQKLFAHLVFAATPIIAVTGLIMTFRLLGAAVIGWAVVLHFVSVAAVVAGLMIHVYMGAVFPEEKPAFFSMVTGSVNELFAYSHHFKWWRTVKQEQQAWEAEHEQATPPA